MHREQHRVSQTQKKHLILHGGPSSGKGYSGSPIVKDTDKVHGIITGDMIRVRLDKDSQFRNRWGEKVKYGNLVGDEDLDPMVRARYIRGGVERKNLILWDGWHRTSKQVSSFDNLYFCDGDKVIVCYIKASKWTCRNRNNHRNRIANRIDGGSFDTRWSIYEENTPSVLSAFEECGIEVVEIDGDEDLDVIAQNVWAQWCRLTCVNTPMPNIERRQIPEHKLGEDPRTGRTSFYIIPQPANRF